MTTINECKGRSNRLPCNNQKFMLLFARCDGDRTAQCDNQQHKYAKVEYSEYTKEGVQAHRRQCVPPKSCMLPKASALSTPKMACTLPIASTVSMPYGVYVAQGKYGEYVKGKLIPMDQ